MLSTGWINVLRELRPQKGIYTYWSFAFRGRYDKGSGLRMDHLLLNATAAGLLKSGGVDVTVRGCRSRATTAGEDRADLMDQSSSPVFRCPPLCWGRLVAWRSSKA